VHTRPDRTRRERPLAARAGGSTLALVTTRSRVRCLAPLVIAGGCLVVAQSASPVLAYVLTIAAFVLAFEGGLSLYERVSRAGGIKDYRQ
jgi:hypothetical protein